MNEDAAKSFPVHYDDLELALDKAITALRVAGQQQLGVGVPTETQVLGWGWAFSEFTAALRYVCQILKRQLGRQTAQCRDRDIVSAVAELSPVDLRDDLSHLEEALRHAEVHAGRYYELVSQAVVPAEPNAERRKPREQHPANWV
jgi:hypothetical protein